jgi:hypothetical protein
VKRFTARPPPPVHDRILSNKEEEMRNPINQRRMILVLGLVAALQFVVSGSAVAQLLTATHFPLVEGQAWEYVENGTVTVTKDVLLGLEDVEGVETFVIETLGGEVGFAQERFTNDALGLRFHRASDAGGAGTFVPPVEILPDEFAAGQIFSSSGNVVVGGGFMIPYSSSTTVVGPSTITVPAGTFDTIVVEVTLLINGMPSTDRLYLAEGVGVVRGEANIETPGGITELVEVPEPELAQILPPAFAFLGLVTGKRRLPRRPRGD